MHAVPARLLRTRSEFGLAREALLVALAALTYFGVRNVTAGAADDAFANASRIARLEEWLRLDWERGLQEALLRDDVWVTLANWIYIWGHWPVIATFAVFLYRRHHDDYRLLRNAMFISGGIGFLFFALLPVAPPRLVDPELVDTVTLHSDAYRALQPPGLTNQYAAFPSLHFGWNLLLGIVLFNATRRVFLRAFAIVGPPAMGAAVVLTANHFVLDLAGGVAVVLVGYALARRGLGRQLR
jgi:PAP2 superfamily protein